MKVLVHWTTTKPGDWQELDLKYQGAGAQRWVKLPKKPNPNGKEKLDDERGWVFALNIQGVILYGWDHYAVKPLKNGGVKAYTWNDDPEDDGDAWGEVWTFNPLRKDPDFEGQLNTHQTKVIYSDNPERFPRMETTGGLVKVKPWYKFPAVASSLTRHGVWVRDEKLLKKHYKSPRRRGWREWK